MTDRIRITDLRNPDRLHADDWIWLTPEELAALLDIALLAKHVATEPTGHQLGGEHPLYIALCSLDEALDRFDFA